MAQPLPDPGWWDPLSQPQWVGDAVEIHFEFRAVEIASLIFVHLLDIL